MKSPLSYLGGKSRLADRIVKLIPPDHICYCEPYCGAAWILFRKAPSKAEVINDADGELVTFWRVIQNHLEEFLRFYKYAICSRKIFDLENLKNPRTLTDIQRAVRYHYLQKLGFGGKTHGRTFGMNASGPSRLNISTIEERLMEVHWRLERVTIENLDGCACIECYDRPTTFFYIDPPYWETAGYAVPFKAEDYTRLNQVLGRLKGRFILSLNDTKAARAIFRQFRIKTIETAYSAGNGREEANGRATVRRELLISKL